uniref:Uncharacterized protein n=1 Tax=Anopheles farauti TaxID=69004 RepID=A0A182QD67_9DIPT
MFDTRGGHELRICLQYREELLLLLGTGGRILQRCHQLRDGLLGLGRHLRLARLVWLTARLLLLCVTHHHSAALHRNQTLPYAGHQRRTTYTAAHDALLETCITFCGMPPATGPPPPIGTTPPTPPTAFGCCCCCAFGSTPTPDTLTPTAPPAFM